MSKVINMVKKNGKWLAAGVGTGLMSAQSFAVDHTTAINAAGADATGNVTAAVLVVVGILAIVTGLGVISKLLGR